MRNFKTFFLFQIFGPRVKKYRVDVDFLTKDCVKGLKFKETFEYLGTNFWAVTDVGGKRGVGVLTLPGHVETKHSLKERWSCGGTPSMCRQWTGGVSDDSIQILASSRGPKELIRVGRVIISSCRWGEGQHGYGGVCRNGWGGVVF
eukprot:748432-Hanusia_phi.AAC.6